MSAVTAGRQVGTGFPLGRLARFLMVGGVSTSIYAVGTVLIARMGHGALSPGEASTIAYILGAAFSYAAHKVFTFRSGGAHAVAAPRFATSTALGLSLSYCLAEILTAWLRLPIELPVILASILVPVMNYILLSRWVFAEPAG